MHDLQEILQYAEANNMMNLDFQTVYKSYQDYLKDYYESLIADEEIDRQKEEDYYADAV
jgi:hypothetical protein